MNAITDIQAERIVERVKRDLTEWKTTDESKAEYLLKQRKDMDKAMRAFRKNPNSRNWGALEVNMLYFQQTDQMIRRIKRETLCS